MLENFLVVVPARLGSSRLKNKPLQDLGGKPLIIRVWENLRPLLDRGAEVLIATDADEVYQACRRFKAPVVMSLGTHESGTDRCAEAASGNQRQYIMNVQGDEPFVNIDDLTKLAITLKSNQNISMATLYYPCYDRKKYSDPGVVKVVSDRTGRALYFSRAPIPFYREQVDPGGFVFNQHLGIYAFKKESLVHFCSLPVGSLERAERLEQLRALENGLDIWLVKSENPGLGIDTPQDLQKARDILRQQQGGL